MAALLLIVSLGSANAQDSPLPPGRGVEKVMVYCSICHGLRLVAQQRLSREVWTETVNLMLRWWGNPVPAQDREAIIDYLSEHLGPVLPQ